MWAFSHRKSGEGARAYEVGVQVGEALPVRARAVAQLARGLRAVDPWEAGQRVQGVRVARVADLVGAATGQRDKKFRLGQVAVAVAQLAGRVDPQRPDLTPRRLLRLDRGAARDGQCPQRFDAARFGSVVASPDSTDRAAR